VVVGLMSDEMAADLSLVLAARLGLIVGPIEPARRHRSLSLQLGGCAATLRTPVPPTGAPLLAAGDAKRRKGRRKRRRRELAGGLLRAVPASGRPSRGNQARVQLAGCKWQPSSGH